MGKAILALFALTTLVGPAAGQTLPKAGQSYQLQTYDLDRNGKPEKIVLVAYKVNPDEGSYWGRLKVLDSAGQVLWAAPTATAVEQPYAFGNWSYGSSGLEWLGDIDGDGKADLLSPAPVSDVRPTTYRRFRWTGKLFQALSPKMLLAPMGASGNFAWRDPIEWDGVQPLTWVMSLSGGPSRVVADVMSYRNDGSIWVGKALGKGNGLGLQVTSWLRPLGPSD